MSHASGPIPAAVETVLREKRAADRIAIVGASTNPEKYGNIVLRNLRDKGYTVVPINPAEPEIEGIKAYPSVRDAGPGIAIAVLLVPPRVVLPVLKGLAGLDVPVVWFQPGSEDEASLAYARDHFTHVVSDACIMVVTNHYV